MKKRNLAIIFVVLVLSIAATAGIVSFAGNSSDSSVTIYYNGYSNPNIHYKIGSGNWTSVPGVAMTASSELDGFAYEINIDTNGDTLTACFNDGNGNWDSNNGQNYTFEPGTYTYSNGQITSIELEEKENTLDAVFKFRGGTPKTNSAYTLALESISNGTAPYYLSISYCYNGGEVIDAVTDAVWSSATPSATNFGMILTKSGELEYFYSVRDSSGLSYTGYTAVNVEGFYIQTVATTPKNTAELGTTVNFTNITGVNAFYGNGSLYGSYPKYTLNIERQGSDDLTVLQHNNSYSRASWTPTHAGEYNINITGIDAQGQEATYFMTYTITGDDTDDTDDIEVTDNEITIYYNGYSNPYIHFQTAPYAWTTAPGIAMSACDDVDGYTHKYVITLEDDTDATVCFNDGNGNWDSNNGQNYTFTEGVWGFSNGKIANLAGSFTYPDTPIVTDEPVVTDTPSNVTKIYYKGYSNPNIHYKIGNGSWTSVPGVAMTSTTEADGYTHVISIDLGTATTLTACFNNGSGNWDSNNGQNYTFGAGTYYYSNGTINQ